MCAPLNATPSARHGPEIRTMWTYMRNPCQCTYVVDSMGNMPTCQHSHMVQCAVNCHKTPRANCHRCRKLSHARNMLCARVRAPTCPQMYHNAPQWVQCHNHVYTHMGHVCAPCTHSWCVVACPQHVACVQHNNTTCCTFPTCCTPATFAPMPSAYVWYLRNVPQRAGGGAKSLRRKNLKSHFSIRAYVKTFCSYISCKYAVRCTVRSAHVAPGGTMETFGC